MVKVTVDFNKQLGKIKPMHAVGQPPFKGGFLKLDFTHFHYITDANIPYSRLHDVGGSFGSNRYVDVPNIFRDFDADENDPESYDFAFTDILLENMHAYGIKPIYRLGVTIENQAHIKAYRIFPPKDPAKWARICEHIIRHYNEGWANGFHYDIEYWEIWNEPDNGEPGRNQMWIGTNEQFYELYDVAAKHLKACFGDKIKIGGYGSSGLYGLYYHPDKYGVNVPKREPDERYVRDTHRLNFFNGFLDYIVKHGSPLDYFSWHSYANPDKTAVIGEYIARRFAECGYPDLELHLNEWNAAHEVGQHGTAYASAANATMMLKMHSSKTYMLCYYDARYPASAYGGFFAPFTAEPVSTYYAFYAFGKLFELGTHVESTVESTEGSAEDISGFQALAAVGEGGSAVYLVNFSEESRRVTTNIPEGFKVYLLDGERHLELSDLSPSDFTLEPNQIAFIEG